MLFKKIRLKYSTQFKASCESQHLRFSADTSVVKIRPGLQWYWQHTYKETESTASAGLLHQNQGPDKDCDHNTWERCICIKGSDTWTPRPVVVDPSLTENKQGDLPGHPVQTSPKASASCDDASSISICRIPSSEFSSLVGLFWKLQATANTLQHSEFVWH